jgi:hypothetical protein
MGRRNFRHEHYTRARVQEQRLSSELLSSNGGIFRDEAEGRSCEVGFPPRQAKRLGVMEAQGTDAARPRSLSGLKRRPGPARRGSFCPSVRLLHCMSVVGGAVLSHRAAPAVPSAQRGLTSEFGMGSGVIPRAVATDRWCVPALLLQEKSGVERGGSVRAAVDQETPGACVRASRWTGFPRVPLRVPLRGVPLAGPPSSSTPVKPHGPLVRLGCMHCCTSTCRLSTQWSSAALQEGCPSGRFILGRASHLDAFSGYPCRT